MPTEPSAHEAAYREAMRHYLAAPDEGARNRAYELGHQALEADLGLLELAAIHRSAMHEALAGQPAQETVARGMDFLIESLSTFEMAQQGYREAQERAAREHEVALTLQRRLLPREVPACPGIDVAVRYLPAGLGSEVGGDWYDVIELPGRRLGLVVGDIVGHGLHPAVVMGQLRMTLRASLLDGDPLDVAADSADTLLQRLGDLLTATLVLAVVDLDDATLTLLNAGHPPPVVIDREGRARYLLDGHSPLLGLPDPFERPVHGPVGLEPGCCLLLYTDGLFEPHERAGHDGLALLLCAATGFSGTPDELCTDVARALIEGPPTDDICLLAAALTPPRRN